MRKKKRTAATLPDPCLRVPKSMGYASVEHPLYSSHLITQSRKRSPVLQLYSRYRMTSRSQLFQSTAPWAQAEAMRAATPRKPSGTRRVRLEPRAATDNSRRFWSRFKAYLLYLFPEFQQQKSCTNARKHTRNHQKSRWRETVGSVTTDPEW